MSCVRCQFCAEIIDSDEDPECFVELPWTQQEFTLCETCREDGSLDEYIDENTPADTPLEFNPFPTDHFQSPLAAAMDEYGLRDKDFA